PPVGARPPLPGRGDPRGGPPRPGRGCVRPAPDGADRSRRRGDRPGPGPGPHRPGDRGDPPARRAAGLEPVDREERESAAPAPKEARVIRGVLPGTTVAEFKAHLAAGTIEQCLNVMDVKEQDVIFIPPGTIHSAYGGVVFLEVQQNSDTTYRLSDWGRVGSDRK